MLGLMLEWFVIANFGLERYRGQVVKKRRVRTESEDCEGGSDESTAESEECETSKEEERKPPIYGSIY